MEGNGQGKKGTMDVITRVEALESLATKPVRWDLALVQSIGMIGVFVLVGLKVLPPDVADMVLGGVLAGGLSRVLDRKRNGGSQ